MGELTPFQIARMNEIVDEVTALVTEERQRQAAFNAIFLARQAELYYLTGHESFLHAALCPPFSSSHKVLQ
jgi:hypothetical protein